MRNKKIKAVLGFLFLFVGIIQAQQISPIELLMHPDQFKATVTGVGSGDMKNLSLQTGQLSAQGAFEMCFATHLTKKKGNLITYPFIFRYNVLTASRIFQQNEFNVRSIAFVDNNQTINIGFRVRNLSDAGEDFLLHGPFVDYSYSEYKALDSLDEMRFSSHNLIGGYVLGFLMETSAGPIGIQFAPQVSYLNVTDENPQSFQRALDLAQPVSSNFFGGSFKAIFQFNDLSFFFDLKKYFPAESSATIPGLTDKPIISFGGTAMGTFLKFKRKD